MSIRKFTKAQRQEIVDEFVSRHGHFDAEDFEHEVRLTNGTHVAWSWFEWNDGEAAQQYRIWQARTFVQGLKIHFKVEIHEREGKTVVAHEVPSLLSPLDRRREGGGYYATDPHNPAHMAELRLQGAASLETWLRRYASAFELVGGDTAPFYAAVRLLRPEREAAA